MPRGQCIGNIYTAISSCPAAIFEALRLEAVELVDAEAVELVDTEAVELVEAAERFLLFFFFWTGPVASIFSLPSAL